MPPIVSTDWRRCIFPPNQLFLYFTTTKVIEKASNYKVLFNNVYRLAAAPLNCCKLRATRLASGMNAKAHKTVLIIRLSVSLYLMYKHGIFPDARRVAPIRGSVL